MGFIKVKEVILLINARIWDIYRELEKLSLNIAFLSDYFWPI
jgi:hypothetical protein